MHPWSQATEQEYRSLPLRAHALLAGVPVHDVWRVTLPGGGASRSMLDVRAATVRARGSSRMGMPVRALFRLRWWLGRVFRWDSPDRRPNSASLLDQLSASDREQSLVPPGTPDGPFTVLYVHPTEALSEIRNATVHGFVVWMLEPEPQGYQVYLAVHVLPVNRWTAPYLALIEPFRRWLVYPAMLRGLHHAWGEHVAASRPTAGQMPEPGKVHEG